MLIEKGITYAPDFLVNSGGLINVYSEYTGYKREIAMASTENIYSQTLDIFKKAAKEGMSTQAAAIQLAEKRIADMAKVKSTY